MAMMQWYLLSRRGIQRVRPTMGESSKSSTLDLPNFLRRCRRGEIAHPVVGWWSNGRVGKQVESNYLQTAENKADCGGQFEPKYLRERRHGRGRGNNVAAL